MKKITLTLLLFCAVAQSKAPTVELPLPTEVLRPLETYADIYAYMIEINVRFPGIAIKISRKETGNLKSALCADYHNLFGMRHPKRRPTTASRKGRRNFAVFETRRKSVRDWKLFEGQYGECTEKQFIRIVRKYYSFGNYSLRNYKVL